MVPRFLRWEGYVRNRKFKKVTTAAGRPAGVAAAAAAAAAALSNRESLPRGLANAGPILTVCPCLLACRVCVCTSLLAAVVVALVAVVVQGDIDKLVKTFWVNKVCAPDTTQWLSFCAP